MSLYDRVRTRFVPFVNNAQDRRDKTEKSFSSEGCEGAPEGRGADKRDFGPSEPGESEFPEETVPFVTCARVQGQESNLSSSLHSTDSLSVSTRACDKRDSAGSTGHVPTKGHCFRCGAAVTWQGPLAGLVNWLDQPVHLLCPAKPDDVPEAAEPEGEPERVDDPSPFDDVAHERMLHDRRIVLQDAPRALRSRRTDLNDPIWHDANATPCAICGDGMAWRPERETRWRCRTCDRPNARLRDVVWRAARPNAN